MIMNRGKDSWSVVWRDKVLREGSLSHCVHEWVGVQPKAKAGTAFELSFLLACFPHSER